MQNKQEYEYMLLHRCYTDCLAYLKFGNKNLWGITISDHCYEMELLYDKLHIKPEWLTQEALMVVTERMYNTIRESK